MYEAFDQFLAVSTWHTHHPLDQLRFFVALETVVRNEKFSPYEMGGYMRAKIGTAHGSPLSDSIDRLSTGAWAVREFMQANLLSSGY
jgi:hypothetical protein